MKSLVASLLILMCGPTLNAQPARPKGPATEAASRPVPKPVVLPEADEGSDDTTIWNNHVALNTGVILLSPYSLTTNGIVGDSTNRRRLEKNDGTEAKFFVDLAVNYVWAWDTERRARFANETTPNKSGDYDGFEWNEFPLDVQAHISYYAIDDKETTVSAIIGSGSFGAEVTLGIPVYRALYTHGRTSTADFGYDRTDSVHWVGLVASYSAVTDADAFDVHDRLLLGIGYRAAFRTQVKDSESKRHREAVLSITGGAAGVETIKFLNDGTREIQLHHEDIPKYRTSAAFALEAEVYYPVTSSLSAVMGTRIYSGLDPNTWNAYFGLTVPLDKLVEILK
jgi:hypothetical protein